MLSLADVELIAPPEASLAEGPCWDPARQELLWVDIPAGTLYRRGDGGESRASLGRRVSAAIPADDGRILVCRQGDIVLLDRASGAVERVTELEPGIADMRTNDAKCDAAGRLWVGTTELEHAPRRGTLYRVEGRARPVPVVTDVTCSNGIGWSPDGETMYFIDSTTRRVDRFHFDLDSGEISDRESFVEMPPGPAVPDGLCVDVEGCVWVALWDGGCVRRYAPEGRLVGQVDLPVAKVTSCCFGGPGWTELYITTAKGDRAPESLAGGVFRAAPGVAGLPTNVFLVSR